MENQKKAEKKYNHSVRKKFKQIVAVTLSLLMITSVIDYSGFIVNAEEPSNTRTITAIEGLDENISSQQIAVGADEAEINLPATINVTVESFSQDNVQTSENSTAINPEEIPEEIIKLENITWNINATESALDHFDSSIAESIFIYEPTLLEGYTLSEEVTLPQIQVTIVQEEDSVGNLVNEVSMVSALQDIAPEGDGQIASVTVSENAPVNYSDFADALSAAQSISGSTLTLLGDVDRGNQTITIASGKTLTIDTNGHTLSFWPGDQGSGIFVEEGATFTLVGNSPESATVRGTPAIRSTTAGGYAWAYPINTRGTCTVDSAYIEGNGIASRGVHTEGGSLTVRYSTIKGGTISIYNLNGEVYFDGLTTLEGSYAIYGNATVNSDASLIINNGNLGSFNTFCSSTFCVNGTIGGNFVWNTHMQSDSRLITTEFTADDFQITDSNGNSHMTYTGNAIETKVNMGTKTIRDSAGVPKEVTIDTSSYTQTFEKQGTDSNWSEVNEVIDAGIYRVKYVSGAKTITKEFTVDKATPTISLEVIVYEDDPFVYNNLMYFTTTVTGMNGDYPSGTVDIMDGTDVLFTDVYYSTHSYFFQQGSDDVPAGDHSFTAVFTPSTEGTGKNYVGVTSAVVEQGIGKAEQKAFNINEVTNKQYGDTSFTLLTTGGSGTGEVTYSVPENNGVLTISGDTATIVGAGTVTITAVKASDNNYNSTTATYDITVAKAQAPSIIFPIAGGITYGQKMSECPLNGGSTEYGTFTWEDGDLFPVVFSETNSNNVIFTPSAETIKNYETISNIYNKLTLGFTVTQATPTISLEQSVYGNPGNRTAYLTVIVNPVGGGNYPTGTLKFMDCTSGTPVDITDATAVTMSGSQTSYTWKGLADKTYKIKVVYSGDEQYNAVTSEEFEVDTVKKNQSALSFGQIGKKKYGDGVFTVTANGGNGQGWVSFTSSDPTIVSFPVPPLDSPLNVSNEKASNSESVVATIHKAGTVTITATKYGDNTYNNTSTSMTLTIEKKELVVKADDKKNIVVGSAMPQLTYSVTGLVSGDTYTGATIAAAADTNTLGEHEIRISGGSLTNAANYKVTYTNAKLTVVSIGLEGAVVSGITDQNYNGTAIEQSGLSVWINGKTLTKDMDYTLAYKNNTQVGTATVTISGIGIYTGTIEKNFQINSPTPTPTPTPTPVSATGLTLSQTSVDLKARDMVSLVATIKPADTTDKGVTFSSSDTQIATVDENGTVTGKGIGSATITATSKSNLAISASCSFNVSIGKITGLTATKNKTNSITLAWDKQSNIAGYQIYRYNSSNKKYEKIATIKKDSTTTYTDKKRSSATNYSYKVRAYVKIGKKTQYGSYSNILKTATQSSKPVLNVKAGSKKVTITWDKVNNVSGYEIYMSTSKNTGFTEIKSLNSKKTTYTKTKLTKGTTYYFKIRTYKTVDGVKIYSSYSNVKKVKVK